MAVRKTVFVTGATGAQGGAVVDALLGGDVTIRALVRDPATASARQLAERRVELAQGDFDDAASLARATQGVSAVFSVQVLSIGDIEGEVRTGHKLVEAALANGVEQFVHTSVARAGEHESFAGWAERRWWPGYWTGKAEVNRMVREAGFPSWVILKPAYMMDNFIEPKSDWMFPGLKARGVIESAMTEDSRLDLIAAADIGRIAAAAIADPDRFHRKEVPLAADSMTMREVGNAIEAATGKLVGVNHVTAEESVALGNTPGLAESQQWASEEGYKVDIGAANGHGAKLEHFADWARRMAAHFTIHG